MMKLFYFFLKTYVVDSHWKCSVEALLISFHNMTVFYGERKQMRYIVFLVRMNHVLELYGITNCIKQAVIMQS